MSANPFILGFRKGIRPDKTLSISQWADNKRQIPKEGAAEPGQWRTSRFPFLREIMDELSPQSPTQQVKVIKGTQVGGTEIGNNFLLSTIDQNPRSMLLLLPTEKLMKNHRVMKLQPSIEAMPDLDKKIKRGKTKSDIGDNDKMSFAGGSLIFGHSNSTANYRSLSFPYICLDDVDAFPLDVNEEGSPMELAKKRADTFADRKIYINSTPTIAGESNIELEFEESDQREYFMPCPECNEMVYFKHESFYIPYDKENYKLIGDVKYICEHCGSMIDEFRKTWMMDEKNGAKWIPLNPGHAHKGYRIPSFLSPVGFLSWNEIYTEWVEAQKLMKRGNDTKLKTWTNTRAGRVWEQQFEKLEVDFLLEKREEYDFEVPNGVLILIAAVDTQDNRLELEVVGFGENDEKWAIDRQQFLGDPAQLDVWKELDDYIFNTTFTHQDGEMKIYATGVDSGGNKTKHVMNYCKNRLSKRVYALKGAQALDAPLISARDANKSKYKTPFYMVGVKQTKDDVFGSLKINTPGASYHHFPKDDIKYNEEYFNQLLSERKVNGRWEKIAGRRNEAFDINGYVIGVLAITGINMKKLAQRGPWFYSEKKKTITTTIKKRRRILSKGVN